jgi:hypothetical protein
LRKKQSTVIPGEVLFKLYDTYGFPTDLTADIVEADGFSIDEAGFESCMEEQRKKAREHWKGSGEEAVGTIYRELIEQGNHVNFIGYNEMQANSKVVALLHDGEQVSQARVGEQIEILTETTPFYGESGGQAGDIGSISADGLKVDIIETRKPLPELIVHVGKVTKGTLEMGQDVQLTVDTTARQATASLATTSSRRAHWWRQIVCVSISAIILRSLMMSLSASKPKSTGASVKTVPWRPARCQQTRLSQREQQLSLAKNTVSVSESSIWVTSAWNSAGAPTRPQPEI